LTIPANATGRLPVRKEQAESFALDGEALRKSSRIHALNRENNDLEFEIPAGTYRFEITLPSVD
jgi:hypothetical protein